jgi:hypothetical protein
VQTSELAGKAYHRKPEQIALEYPLAGIGSRFMLFFYGTLVLSSQLGVFTEERGHDEKFLESVAREFRNTARFRL